MASHRSAPLTRRGFLAGAAASCTLLERSASAPSYAAGSGSSTGDPWRQAELIVNRLAWLGDTPERRRRELRQFYVTSFGAAQCQLVEVPLIYTSGTTSASGLAPAPGSPDNYAAFSAAAHHREYPDRNTARRELFGYRRTNRGTWSRSASAISTRSSALTPNRRAVAVRS